MGTTASTPSSPPTQPPRPLPSTLEGLPSQVYTKTGYDPTSRWRTYTNIFNKSMTPHGEYLFVEDIYHKREAEDCKRCDEDLRWLLSYSPIVRFLGERIGELGGGGLVGQEGADVGEGGKRIGAGSRGWKEEMNASIGKIKCERCITRVVPKKDAQGKVMIGADGEPEREYLRKGGGFSPEVGILLCANEVRTRGDLEDVLAHEMVHAWDHLRWKVDWMDLRHAACTEIRASALSGECRWTREFFTRNHWSVTQQFQNCVRNRAVRSVMARPNCKDDVMAAKVVNEVFESCFNDTRPFDEVYK